MRIEIASPYYEEPRGFCRGDAERIDTRVGAMRCPDRWDERRGWIAMIERRSIVRHKTFIKGRIYFNNRLSSMDCIVRDVTDNGSRLEFSESVALPEMFELYMPNKDEYSQARAEGPRAIISVSHGRRRIRRTHARNPAEAIVTSPTKWR